MPQTFPSGGPYEDSHGYSRAVRVGTQVFVSGTCAREPHIDGCDAYEQAVSALAVVETTLTEAGASMADVVRTVAYIVDPADADLVSRAHREALGHVRPAATMVVVAQLIDPALKVEIQVDAVVPEA